MRRDREHDATLRAARDMVDALPGSRFYLLHQGRVRGTPGLPDGLAVVSEDLTDLMARLEDELCKLEACYAAGIRRAPRLVWFEAKTGKARQTDEQKAFETATVAAGVPIVVGYAGDLAEFLGLTEGRRERK